MPGVAGTAERLGSFKSSVGEAGVEKNRMRRLAKLAADRMRELGAQYGQELAAAAMLALMRGGNDSPKFRADLAKAVVGEISRVAETLEQSRVPSFLVELYRVSCIAGFRYHMRRTSRAEKWPPRKVAKAA
jgi:hypothetical protein